MISVFIGIVYRTSINGEFRFNAKAVDVLILSHAHIHHTGLIPKLLKKDLTGKYFARLPQKK